MKTLAFASAVALLAGSVATAGSFVEPTVEPIIAAPAPVVTDWSGFYLGALAGSMTGNEDYLGTDYAFVGFRYGGFVGYNHQMASGLVVGAELAASIGEQHFPDPTEVYDMTIIDAKARVGMTFDRALVFASAGFSTASYAGQNGWGDYEGTGFNVGVGADVLITDNVFVGGEVVYRGLEDSSGAAAWTETLTTVKARVGIKF